MSSIPGRHESLGPVSRAIATFGFPIGSHNLLVGFHEFRHLYALVGPVILRNVGPILLVSKREVEKKQSSDLPQTFPERRH